MSRILILILEGHNAVELTIPSRLVGIFNLIKIKSIKMKSGAKIDKIWIDEQVSRPKNSSFTPEQRAEMPNPENATDLPEVDLINEIKKVY